MYITNTIIPLKALAAIDPDDRRPDPEEEGDSSYRERFESDNIKADVPMPREESWYDPSTESRLTAHVYEGRQADIARNNNLERFSDAMDDLMIESDYNDLKGKPNVTKSGRTDVLIEYTGRDDAYAVGEALVDLIGTRKKGGTPVRARYEHLVPTPDGIMRLRFWWGNP